MRPADPQDQPPPTLRGVHHTALWLSGLYLFLSSLPAPLLPLQTGNLLRLEPFQGRICSGLCPHSHLASALFPSPSSSCKETGDSHRKVPAHTWRKDVSPTLRSFPQTNTGPKFLDTVCCTAQAGASKGRFDSCCCHFPWRRTHHVTSGTHAATRAPLS